MVTIESQLEGIEIQQNNLNGLYAELDSIKNDIEMNKSELEVLELQSADISIELDSLNEDSEEYFDLHSLLEEINSKISTLEYQIGELEFDRDELLEVIEDGEDQLIALQNGLCELEDDV